jgi:hypothetical protein
MIPRPGLYKQPLGFPLKESVEKLDHLFLICEREGTMIFCLILKYFERRQNTIIALVRNSNVTY